MDALQLIQVSHDEIVASVLQQLFFEMLWRMQVLARWVRTLAATLNNITIDVTCICLCKISTTHMYI